jgi:hypothetical protein
MYQFHEPDPYPVIVPIGYSRISREDLKRGQTTEQHYSILLQVAQMAGLSLTAEQIVFEVESGNSLEKRAEFERLLDLCRRRMVTHVITVEVARLTRGMEDDWAAVKRALYRGEVTLVLPPGRSYRFDLHLDTSALDQEALQARQHNRRYSYKRYLHNAAKIAMGRRICGSVPYGYRMIGATYDAAGHPITPGRVEVHPFEYTIVTEIFRRAMTGVTRNAIASDLSLRGIPAPFASRGVLRAMSGLWSHASVTSILTNPWFCGLVGHRHENRPEQGTVKLPREKWVLAPVDKQGDWPCPVTIEEWEELQSILAATRPGGAPSVGLLTGLLHCAKGRPMALSGGDYGCSCSRNKQHHAASSIAAHRIDTYARRVVEEAIASLPVGRLPPPKGSRSRTEAYAALAQAQRDLAAKERALDDLMLRADMFLSLPDFGKERYQANIEILTREGEALRSMVRDLRAEVERPDTREISAILAKVRKMGERIWEPRQGWSILEMRQLVRLVVERIELPEKERLKHHHALRVIMRPEFRHYAPPPFQRPTRRNPNPS